MKKRLQTFGTLQKAPWQSRATDGRSERRKETRGDRRQKGGDGGRGGDKRERGKSGGDREGRRTTRAVRPGFLAPRQVGGGPSMKPCGYRHRMVSGGVPVPPPSRRMRPSLAVSSTQPPAVLGL